MDYILRCVLLLFHSTQINFTFFLVRDTMSNVSTYYLDYNFVFLLFFRVAISLLYEIYISKKTHFKNNNFCATTIALSDILLLLFPYMYSLFFNSANAAYSVPNTYENKIKTWYNIISHYYVMRFQWKS